MSTLIFRTPIINDAIDDLSDILSDLIGGDIEAPRDRVGIVIESLGREYHPLVDGKVREACDTLTKIRAEMMRLGNLDAAQYTAVLPQSHGDPQHPAEQIRRVIARLSCDEPAMTAIFMVTRHEYFNPSSVNVILRPAVPFPADTNGRFWSGSPYRGEIKLTVSKPEAQTFFRGGHQYALTFTDLHTFGGTIDSAGPSSPDAVAVTAQ
jgi:hypothetical protein